MTDSVEAAVGATTDATQSPGCAAGCSLDLPACQAVPRQCHLLAAGYPGMEQQLRWLNDVAVAEGRPARASVERAEYQRPEPIVYPPEILHLAATCPHRREISVTRCCGPIYQCVGGRREGQRVEPLSVCAACVVEFGAVVP